MSRRLELMLLLLALASALAAQNPYRYAVGDQPAAIVVIPVALETADNEWKQWEPIAASRHWHLLMPSFAVAGDGGLKNIEKMVDEARTKPGLEKAAFYLIGAGP